MKLGLDRVCEDPRLMQAWGRFALVTHAATTTSRLVSCVEAILSAHPEGLEKLSCVYGPQHGYWQCEPYNMYETPDDVLLLPGNSEVPLYSLYGDNREPVAEHLQSTDTIVVDLPDIGCRIYTYMTTLAGCLKQASQLGKKVVVLDRPNPLGLSAPDNSQLSHRVEGNLLAPELRSFVGWFHIPFRHGLTLGELGYLYIEQEGLTVDYEVIKVSGLTREMLVQSDSSALPRAASPNMPHPKCMSFFPVSVSLEGTNVSEGRGTTTPFQLVGAPFMDEHRLNEAFQSALSKLGAAGLVNSRPFRFLPGFDKYKGQVCKGIFLDKDSMSELPRFTSAIALLSAIAISSGAKLSWREVGYEYNFKDNPLDLILGHKDWRESLEKLIQEPDSESNWKQITDLLQTSSQQAQSFAERSKRLFLYS